MSDQDKLSKQQINELRSARMYLGAALTWGNTEEGHDYWHDVDELLGLKVKHGTSDGKPYVEPQRWRVPTDEDAKSRPKCRYRDKQREDWREGILLHVSATTANLPEPFAVIRGDGACDVFTYCEVLDTPE